MTYWRHAGMSYLKYANTCAEVLRGVLKDGARQRAKAREAVYFRQAAWKDGKPQAQVITDMLENLKPK